MDRVAKELATEGFIYGLFQPAWGAKNAFRLVVALAGNAAAWRKILAWVIAVIAIAPIETLLVLVLLVGIGYLEAGWPGVKSALLPSLLCAYAAGTLGSVLRVARVARAQPTRPVHRPAPRRSPAQRQTRAHRVAAWGAAGALRQANRTAFDFRRSVAGQSLRRRTDFDQCDHVADDHHGCFASRTAYVAIRGPRAFGFAAINSSSVSARGGRLDGETGASPNRVTGVDYYLLS